MFLITPWDPRQVPERFPNLRPETILTPGPLFGNIWAPVTQEYLLGKTFSFAGD